jgi:hypothetical protein
VWDQVAGALGGGPDLAEPTGFLFSSARDFQTQLRECRARHWVAPPDIGNLVEYSIRYGEASRWLR